MRGVPMERSSIGMRVNLMNSDERRIVKRMIDEENLEGTNAESQGVRVQHINRRNALRDLLGRFARASERRKQKQAARANDRMEADAHKKRLADPAHRVNDPSAS